MANSKQRTSRIPAWLRAQPVAHRGLHGTGVPENSLAAFAAAIACNYAIELDVRMTADGIPVVFHDASLMRMTGTRGDLSATPARILGDLKLAQSDERIPTLKKALQFVDARTPLLIELKHHRPIGHLETAVSRLLDHYQGPFAIQAFDPGAVVWFRKHRPHFLRGQLAGDFREAEMLWFQRAALARMLFNFHTAPDFLAYDHRCLPPPIRRRPGIPLLAWTVSSAQEASRALHHADNIIFEGFHPTSH